MNKKTKLAIIGVIGLVLATLSLTYAYWIITRTQTKENVITAGCLDISLSNEKNDISLTEQFPISDEEGKELTPYTFTVTNNCNTAVDYYLNLEALGDKDTAISASSLKVMVNDYKPTILGDDFEEEPTNADAYASYRLDFGTLAKNGSAEYTLRLWLDKDASINEMNKSFSSKVSVTVGQGINNPLKEGMLAYDLVSQYGGKDAITSRSYKYEEQTLDNETNYHLVPSASYYWGTAYDFDIKTKKYTITGDVVEATIAECREGTKKCGKYLMLNKVYKTNLIEVISFHGTKEETANNAWIVGKERTYQNGFSNVPVEGDSGIYVAPDDLGVSYYLRGDVTNNYVQFGTYANATTITGLDYAFTENTVDIEENAPMYWRIVRINGDGTIRLIYDGVEKADNYTTNMDIIGFEAYDSSGSVSYTYEENGTQVDSTIKSVIDTWYEDNLKTDYEKYIADGIFCNDLSTVKDTDNQEVYQTYNRNFNTSLPKLSCSQKEDKYTVSSQKGNGYLKNPVGLLTTDEATMAGVKPLISGLSYLMTPNFDGYNFWTMSPSSNSEMIGIGGDGLQNEYFDGTNSYEVNIRPVINLKADVAFTGNGSYETPYVITTN